MAKLRFRREDARELFDQLPLKMNERDFRDTVLPLRVTLTVKSKGVFVFVWVSDKEVFRQPKEYTDIRAGRYYTIDAQNNFKRKGIVKSVDDLYKQVNLFIHKKSLELPADNNDSNPHEIIKSYDAAVEIRYFPENQVLTQWATIHESRQGIEFIEPFQDRDDGRQYYNREKYDSETMEILSLYKL